MRIRYEGLERFGVELLKAAGSEEEEARLVSAHLVGANVRGHDSHGIGMAPAYVRNAGLGLLNPNTSVRLVKEEGSALTYDGGRGYGQRVAMEAVRGLGERVLGGWGVGAMTLAGAHHVGRVGTYGEELLSMGLGGLFFVSVADHKPLAAPYGGRDARLGTNPVCIALPGGEEGRPFLLDMATTRIALGKARVAMNEGVEVGEGMLLDERGELTRDPSVMFGEGKGALVSMGEHKGYGLALACELLAGVLSGGGTIQDGNERLGGIVNHMFCVAFRCEAMGLERGIDWRREETRRLLEYTTSSPSAGEGLPTYPGEVERRTREERLSVGIEVDEATWEELLLSGESVGLLRGDMLGLAGL